jgi:hypothetical protein
VQSGPAGDSAVCGGRGDQGSAGVANTMPINLAKSLPYVLHTNRELGLMLAGKKPLAMFVDGKDCFPEVVCRYLRLFERQVSVGRLVKRDHFEHRRHRYGQIYHHIYFALPGEEWRIDAMIELKSQPIWSQEFERREGELLGYEDWMNDHFLDLNKAAYPAPSSSP